MVTFVANTFFSANGSVITITGLHGAIAPTGPMDLVDGPNGLGHHNVFSAEAISSDWAVTDNRTRGQGYWDNGAKTLTLYLAVDTDCSTEFVFGFTVTNPSTQQSHQDIQIEASWIADTKQTFKPADPPPDEVRIMSAPFVHDMLRVPAATPYAQAGDAAGLRVWALRFVSQSIHQTNSYPCHENTISVVFDIGYVGVNISRDLVRSVGTSARGTDSYPDSTTDTDCCGDDNRVDGRGGAGRDRQRAVSFDMRIGNIRLDRRGRRINELLPQADVAVILCGKIAGIDPHPSVLVRRVELHGLGAI